MTYFYWTCCGKFKYTSNLRVAREALEQHEIKKHGGNRVGSFGSTTRPPENQPIPKPPFDPDHRYGVIRLDTTQPDEACLLPPEWGGRYPKMTGPERLTKLSEQQNHRCCYCGKHTWTKHYGEDGVWQDMATIEHIVARNNGGTNKKGNIVMACAGCNNLRHEVKRLKANPANELPYILMLEVQGRLPDWEIVPPVEVSERPASTGRVSETPHADPGRKGAADPYLYTALT